MEDDLVHINDAKYSIVGDNKGRIERLFGVKVEVAQSENGKCCCHFVCSDDNAQENMDKAKGVDSVAIPVTPDMTYLKPSLKPVEEESNMIATRQMHLQLKLINYLLALTAEGKGFSVTTETYDLDIVDMILMHKDNIEKQSAAVIITSPSSNNVKIQGQLENILLTKNLIESLIKQVSGDHVDIEGHQNYHRASLSQQQDINSCLPNFSAIDHTEALTESGDFTPSIDENNDHKELDHDHLDTDSMYVQPQSWAGQNDITQKNEKMGIHSSIAQLKISSHYSEDESSDYSDDEEIIKDIQRDPEYQSKVEFALKLGYQESDLLEALKKLGSSAGQNELLSELIKQGTSKGDNAVFQDESLLLSPGEEDNSQDYMFIKQTPPDDSSNLRHIIIDGSNVAMSHGNKELFSCRGIKLAVDWFRQRGHNDITVFVPQWRKETSRSDSRIKDQTILNQLEKEKVLVFTPARRIGGKRVVCYDDRYILNLAAETDGIVVSNDNYRDLLGEKEEFKKVIEERLLMYSFVNDRFMPPDDPLGRNGPTLENFLQKEPSQPEPLPPPCPYGSKKCTYGNKCKYYHPERRNQPHKSVTEKLAEQAKQRMQEMRDRGAQNTTEGKQKLSRKTSLHRTQSFNPGDMGRQELPLELQSAMSGSATDLYPDDDKYTQYNQRMAENLRKMQQDHKEKPVNKTPLRENLTRTPEKKESQSKSKNEQSVNQSSPRWTGSSVDTLRQGRSSPRGSSPVSNLIVPGQTNKNYDAGEHFLSGHLLLAKKLSDENESDKLREKRDNFNERDNNEFLLSSSRGQSPVNSKPSLKHPVAKQKLSRQFSLQGREDPRLRQGHTPLQAQFSYDPRRVVLGNQFVSHDLEEGNSLLQDFMQSQSSSIRPPNTNHQNMYGQNQGFNQSITSETHGGHAELSRMQSAPDSYVLQQQHKRPAPMMRQNSSSDSQLHKIDSFPHDNQGPSFSSNVSSHGGLYGDSLMSRGTLPMKDTTGSVTFQIGGPPPQRASSGMPHFRSMGSLNQSNYQQFSPPEMEYIYHHQQQQQHLHQQHMHQQQQQQQHYQHPSFADMPQTPTNMPQTPSNMPQTPTNMPQTPTSMPYNINSNQTIHQNQQNYMFMPPRQGVNDNRQFLDQSHIWADNPSLPNVSQLPPTFTSTPNMTSPGMSPGMMTSPMEMPPIQRQQSAVTSADNMTITPNDPRYVVFCHLRDLFGEEKVKTVMYQHPNAHEPSEICKYILEMKDK